MEERDLNLAEAARRAVKHLPSGEERGAGVSAWHDFVEALEAEFAAEGYRIERFRGPARASDRRAASAAPLRPPRSCRRSRMIRACSRWPVISRPRRFSPAKSAPFR